MKIKKLKGYIDIIKIQTDQPSSILAGDINFKEMGYLPQIICFFIGFISSVIGIGSGMLLSPFLMELKVSPHVTSATTSCMGFLLSTAIIFQYISTLPYAFSSWTFFLGVLGGYSGRRLTIHIVEKYGRQSIITFSLLGVLCISLLLLVVEVVIKKDIMELKNLCS